MNIIVEFKDESGLLLSSRYYENCAISHLPKINEKITVQKDSTQIRYKCAISKIDKYFESGNGIHNQSDKLIYTVSYTDKN